MAFLTNFSVAPAKSGTRNFTSSREIEVAAVSSVSGKPDFASTPPVDKPELHYIVHTELTGDVGAAKYRWFYSDKEVDIVWSDALQQWLPNSQVSDEFVGVGNGITTVFTTLNSKSIFDDSGVVTTDPSLVKVFRTKQNIETPGPLPTTSYTVASTATIKIALGKYSSLPALEMPFSNFSIVVNFNDGRGNVNLERSYIESVDGSSGVITFAQSLSITYFQISYYEAEELIVTSVASPSFTLSASPPTSTNIVASYLTDPDMRWTETAKITNASFSNLEPPGSDPAQVKIKFVSNGSIKPDYRYSSDADSWVPTIQEAASYRYVSFLPYATKKNPVTDVPYTSTETQAIQEVRVTAQNGIPLGVPIALTPIEDFYYDEVSNQLLLVTNSADQSTTVEQAVTENTIGISLPNLPLMPRTVIDTEGFSRDKANANSDGTNIIVKEDTFSNLPLATPKIRDIDYVVDERSGNVTFTQVVTNEKTIGYTQGILNQGLNPLLGYDALRVYLNGEPLFRGTDFTLTQSPSLATLNFSPSVTGNLSVLYNYYKDFSLDYTTGTITPYRKIYAGDSLVASYQYYRDVLLESVLVALGGETSVRLKNKHILADSGLAVYKNSIPLSNSAFSIQVKTGFIQFTQALAPGDIIEADYTYTEFRAETREVVLDRVVGDKPLKLSRSDVVFSPADAYLTSNFPFVVKFYDGVTEVAVATTPFNSVTPDYTFDVASSILTFTQELGEDYYPDPIGYPKFNALNKTIVVYYWYEGSPVSGEVVVSEATGLETSFSLAHSNIVEGSFKLTLNPAFGFQEDITEQVNGIATEFALTNFPVVGFAEALKTTYTPGDIIVKFDGGIEPSANYALNGLLGIITFTSPPTSGTEVVVEHYFNKDGSGEPATLVEVLSETESFISNTYAFVNLKRTNVQTSLSSTIPVGIDQIVIQGAPVDGVNLQYLLEEKAATYLGGVLQFGDDLYEIDYIDYNLGLDQTRVFLASTTKDSYIPSTLVIRCIPRLVSSDFVVALSPSATNPILQGDKQFTVTGDQRLFFVPSSVLVFKSNVAPITSNTGTTEFNRVGNAVYDEDLDETTVFTLSSVARFAGYDNTTAFYCTAPVVDEGTTTAFPRKVIFDSLVVTETNYVPVSTPLSNGTDYTVLNNIFTLTSPLAFKDKIISSYRAYRVLDEFVGSDENYIQINWWYLTTRDDISSLEIDYTFISPDNFYFKLIPDEKKFTQMREAFAAAEEQANASGPGPGPFNSDNSLESKGLAGPLYRLKTKEVEEYIVQEVCEAFNERVNDFELLRRYRYGFLPGAADGMLTSAQIEDSKQPYNTAVDHRLHPTDDAAVITYTGYNYKNIANLPVLNSDTYAAPVAVDLLTLSFTPPTGTADDGTLSAPVDYKTSSVSYLEANEVSLSLREKEALDIERTALLALKSYQRPRPTLFGRLSLGHYMMTNSLWATAGYNVDSIFSGSEVHWYDTTTRLKSFHYTVENTANEDARKAGIFVIRFDSVVTGALYTNATYHVDFYQFQRVFGIPFSGSPDSTVSGGFATNSGAFNIPVTINEVEITVVLDTAPLPLTTPPIANQTVAVIPCGYPVPTNSAPGVVYGSNFVLYPGSAADLVWTTTNSGIKIEEFGTATGGSYTFPVRPTSFNLGQKETLRIDNNILGPEFFVRTGMAIPNDPFGFYTGDPAAIGESGLLYYDLNSSVMFVVNISFGFSLTPNVNYLDVYIGQRAWSDEYTAVYEIRSSSSDTVNLFTDHLDNLYQSLSTSLNTQLTQEQAIIDRSPYYPVNSTPHTNAKAATRKLATQTYYTSGLDAGNVASYRYSFDQFSSSSFFSNATAALGLGNVLTDTTIDNRLSIIGFPVSTGRYLALNSRVASLDSWQAEHIEALFGSRDNYEDLLERRKEWLDLLLHNNFGISRARQTEEDIQANIQEAVGLGGAFE